MGSFGSMASFALGIGLAVSSAAGFSAFAVGPQDPIANQPVDLFGGQGRFQAIVSDVSQNQRDTIFRSLLNSDMGNVKPPDFPRTWHQMTEMTTVSTNVSAGFILAGFDHRLSIDYKWDLATTLTIVGNITSVDAPVGEMGQKSFSAGTKRPSARCPTSNLATPSWAGAIFRRR